MYAKYYYLHMTPIISCVKASIWHSNLVNTIQSKKEKMETFKSL